MTFRVTGEELAAIVGGTVAPDNALPGTFAEAAATDSRHMPHNAVFFALKGSRDDGHNHLVAALGAGASTAVVQRDRLSSLPAEVSQRLIAVDDPLRALHDLASWWRDRLSDTRVIGVTGSNGKTILKDALIRLLNADGLRAAGSPGSFNSRIGVPLSLLSIRRDMQFAVIEAGISEPGDMAVLERMIRPDFGILTNIGLGHISAFHGRRQLAEEKFRLFQRIEDGDIILPAGDELIEGEASRLRGRTHWFGSSETIPVVDATEPTREGIQVRLRYPTMELATFVVRTPSIEIAQVVAMAAAAASLLGTDAKTAERSLARWEPGSTRMEMWRSPGGVTLINDSCSADPLSVRTAVNALADWNPNGPHRRFFVFHGMRGLGPDTERENAEIGALAAEKKVDVLVLVDFEGSDATESAYLAAGGSEKGVHRCATIEEVRDKLLNAERPAMGDVILVKGPRRWGIAEAARHLVDAMAPNRLIVDLEVLRDNIRRFHRHINPTTRILAMVKALAYGSDEARVAVDLERDGLVKHFGVATVDEGLALRAAGIGSPILVTMCTPGETRKAIQQNLTPVVYSREIADHLEQAAEELGKNVSVHIEVDTGMGRLGELPHEVPALAERIMKSAHLHLAGVMTHFASSDDPSADEFTRRQIELFEQALAGLRDMGVTDILRHANATSATARFRESQYDMVRLGLGMFGVYPSSAVRAEVDDLQLAIALVSRIAEIRVLPAGHRIGYAGTYVVPEKNFRVGVVPIGYHDGIPWRLGSVGGGYVSVNGRHAPIVGRISMDSMVIDLSNHPEATTMMDVLIFGRYGGHELRPEEVAAACDTIAYELLARIGPRVQRIFVGECPNNVTQ